MDDIIVYFEDLTEEVTILEGDLPQVVGDMLKSTYDVDDNGVVDNAEKVNGKTVEENVPSGALFTDTVYDDTFVAKVNTTNTFTENQTIEGSVKIGDDINVASETNAGSIRYTETTNNSYLDMVMKTSATVWEWVNIKANYIVDIINLYVARVYADGGTIDITSNLNQRDMEDAILYLKPSGKKAGKLHSQLPIDGVGDFTVDRNSPVLANNKDGILAETPANVPCFEWEDGKPHLLTQPQSTNLLTYSNDFSDVSWAKTNTTITSNAIISPDGNLNGSLVNTIDVFSFLNQISVVSAETEYTFSFFFKDGSKNSVFVAFYDNTAKAFISSNNPYTEKDYGNGWKRIISKITTPAGCVSLVSYPDRSSGIGTFYIYQADLIESSYAQSPIPTTGTTVTRLADDISVTTPAGVTEIIETIDGIEQTPITVIPSTYQIPNGKINKIVMS